MSKKLLSLLIASIVSGQALAQDEVNRTGVDETIEITATRTKIPQSAIPATVTVIDGEQLRQQMMVAESLSDVLGKLIPAFSPSRQKFEETRYEVSQQSVPTRSYPLQPYSDEFDEEEQSKQVADELFSKGFQVRQF